MIRILVNTFASLAVLAAAAGITWVLIQRAGPGESPAARPHSPRIVVAPLRAEYRRLALHGPAVVDDRGRLDLIAEVGGRCRYPDGRPSSGDAIPAGRLVAEIEAPELDAAVDRLEALAAENRSAIELEDRRHAHDRELLEIDESNLELAERTLARQRELLESGGGSQAAVEGARETRNRARSALLGRRAAIEVHPQRRARLEAQGDAIVAQLEEARLRAADRRIVAPWKARYHAVHVEDGQVVAPGAAVCALMPVDRVAVRLHVDERRARRVFGRERLAAWYRGELESPAATFRPRGEPDDGLAYTGELLQIEARVDPATRQLAFLCEFPTTGADGSAPPLLPGQVGRLAIDGREVEGAPVADGAVEPDGTLWAVDDEHRLRRLHREHLPLPDGRRFVLLDRGTAADMRYVLRPAENFHDGLAVRTENREAERNPDE